MTFIGPFQLKPFHDYFLTSFWYRDKLQHAAGRDRESVFHVWPQQATVTSTSKACFSFWKSSGLARQNDASEVQKFTFREHTIPFPPKKSSLFRVALLQKDLSSQPSSSVLFAWLSAQWFLKTKQLSQICKHSKVEFQGTVAPWASFLSWNPTQQLCCFSHYTKKNKLDHLIITVFKTATYHLLDFSSIHKQQM